MANSKVEWPDLPEGVEYKTISVSPLLVSFDCKTFYEVPEGMTWEEFLDQSKSEQGQAV